jgi:hypothetical protein
MDNNKFVRTLAQGALGGITFGIYHAYVSHKMMEENNAKLQRQWETQLNNRNEWKYRKKG